MNIPFDGKPKWASCCFKLCEREVTEFCFKAVHQAEEQVFTVKFENIPCPIRVWCKELTHNHWVFDVFLRVEGWEVLTHLLGQEFHRRPPCYQRSRSFRLTKR